MTKPAAPIPAVTRGPRDPRPGRPPFWVVAVLLLGVIASWIPLAVAARARVARSDEPRIALVQDMADQPKLRPQSASDTFADGRAMRPRPDGVVARGHLEEDDYYYRGFTRKPGSDGKEQVTFFEGFPEQVKVTPE